MTNRYMKNREIGNKLQEWQMKNKYSQQRIIREINEINQNRNEKDTKDILNVNNISKLYYGEMELKVSHIIAWCELMNCTPNDLLLCESTTTDDCSKALFLDKLMNEYNKQFKD